MIDLPTYGKIFHDHLERLLDLGIQRPKALTMAEGHAGALVLARTCQPKPLDWNVKDIWGDHDAI